MRHAFINMHSKLTTDIPRAAAIAERLRRRDPAVLGRALDWYAGTLREWLQWFDNGTLATLPIELRKQILRHLISADLRAFTRDPRTLRLRLANMWRGSITPAPPTGQII